MEKDRKEKENMSTNEQQENNTQDKITEDVVNEQEEQATETDPKTEETAERNLEAELQEANDKFLRLYAEFDNYKRRTAKERVALIQSAGKDVISSLLPVLDDFDRALKAMDQASDVAPVKEGILLVSQKLKKTLSQQGLKEMESIGQAFDSDLQEAITNIPSPSEDMKGKVIDEIEKGYYLNDLVLRHAKVVVGN